LPEERKSIPNQLNDPSPNRTGFLLQSKIGYEVQVRSTATDLAFPSNELPYIAGNLETTQKKDIQVNDHGPSLNRTGFLL
jgi:hypothetical protein